MNADLVAQCGRFSTATLLEASGLRYDLAPEIKPLVESWRVCGRACTVVTAPGHNLWIHRALYEAEPGDVLVVSTGGGHEFGYWGEIMTEAAVARQLGGLVIDGCVRDSLELKELGFPVFARGLCIRGTGKDASVGGGIGQDVRIGEVVVRHGDVVVGDADGVVAIPAGDVQRVSEKASARVGREQEIVERLRAGMSTIEVYGW